MVAATDLDLCAVAARLARHGIDRVDHAGGGGNSRLYRVSGAGREYALKSYPPRSKGSHDRLGVEATALEFLATGGIEDVPRVHAVNREHGFALMDWVDGILVGDDADASDVDKALDFLARIAALTDRPGADDLPAATEACVSGDEILRQITVRLVRLEELSDSEPALAKFLGKSFRPALAKAGACARAGYAEIGLDFVAPLERAHQALVPSDFGFHNIMRQPTGKLVFIDFEYFGWDDPVKLTADFLLHPGTRLDVAIKQRFADGMQVVFEPTLCFPIRLELLYPLFGLRWILILLNEFLPERWRIRAFAGEDTDWATAKSRQLDKVRTMLSDLQTTRMGGVGAR